MPIGSASILDKQRMYSRGRHNRSRCREVEFGPDEIMESPILIDDLVLHISSNLLGVMQHTWAGGTNTRTVSPSCKYLIRSSVQLSNSPFAESLKVSCTCLIFSGVAKG